VIRDDGSVGIPIVPAMEIVKSLGAALSYAHEQDIVHSDFKPSNAFLTQDGKVKVLDFGIARAAPSLIEKGERTLFDAGQLGAISPAYASLEMLRGEEPDVRDDVYAFACVTYELLTGSHPYQRIDALKAYETGLEPRPIRKLSRAQWRVLQQGLAFQRADRCHSVDSLVSQFLVKRSRAKVWIASTAIAVIAIALVGALAWRWDVQRLATLQRGLASSDSTRFSAALAQLSSAPYLLRAQILADDQSRTDLISRVQKEMQLAAARPAYDYTRARALSNQLKGVLPDPQPALQLDRQLDLGLQAELARLITDRDSTLSNSVMIPVQGDPNVTEVLERIRKLDPDNKALREPIIGSTYAEAAAEALHKGKPLLAADITAAGLGVAPEDPMLLQLQRQLETQETASKSQHVQSRSADDSRRELAAVFSNPEANQPWAEKAQEVIKRLAAVVPVSDPDLEKANQVVVSTFVTAAATARGQKRFDEAAALLGIARSFNQQAPEIVAESAALERDRALKSDPVIGEEKRAANEMLEEKFENQAAAGDIAGASATASALGRALGPSTYVARDVPRILISSYVHFAKSEFAAGQVDAALKTLAEGRRKFGKSAELKDLEVRFIAVADVYDRLSTAVALNVADMQHSLEALRASEGEEYETAAQMLAQVLADRIADQRAANRATVADRLLDTGRQIFSNYTELLGRGTAGHLSTTPIIVEDQ
jgi:non-specific serine/threonine protein kinase